MNRTPDLDTLLRSLDAAEPVGPAMRHRAQADLQRILSSDPDAPPPLTPPTAGDPAVVPRSVSRTARRTAIVAGLVAAATAALVVLPPPSGGDPAFASWTRVPAGMSEQERASTAADCRAAQRDTGGGMYSADLDKADVAVAERRGQWTTVVLSGEDGFSALCITDGSDSLFNKGMIGSVGRPSDSAAPGPRELTAMVLGTGTMSAGAISIAAGSAGSDVTGVVYKSSAHQEVQATVSHGRFALWMPGDELQDASAHGIQLELTYRDGTTGTARLAL